MTDDRITRGLEQDAQRREGRNPGIMTKADYAQKVVEQLKTFIKDNKLTQVDICKGIGVSSTTLSLFLRNKYKGNVAHLCNKLTNYIDSYVRKNRRHKTGYINTTIAKRIGNAIGIVEAAGNVNEGKIGIIAGDAGHGKSVCLREFAVANKNSLYIELDSTMSSTAIFAEIAKKLRLDPSGYLKNITSNLVKKLKARSMIVMLDEASFLKVPALDQLRQIITVKCKCTLILAGNRDLLRTISQSSARRGFEALDQFYSRIAYSLDLDEVAVSGDSRGGKIYTADDIRKLYEHGGIRLSRDAVDVLKKICQTPQSGRLRTCTHIIDALRVSRAIEPGQLIEGKVIFNAIKQLGLPVASKLPFTLSDIKRQQRTEQVAAAG